MAEGHTPLGKRGYNSSVSCLTDAAPDPTSGLNLAHADYAVPPDNYVFWIDTLPLNKTNVLPYLDGNATALARSSSRVARKCQIHKSTDASLYPLKGFVTGEKLYPSIETLRITFDAGELGMENDQTIDADWALADYKPELSKRDLEQRLAPATLDIGGKRHKVDEKNQYVDYMGWSFYIALTRTLVVMFYDIRFEGERIIYELSMQEATAQYGGSQPKAANTVYHDTYYSLTTEMGTLVEGYNCSWGPTFWNLTYHDGNMTTINTNSLCIFEADMISPLSRHRYGANNDYGFSKLGTVKGAQLIVSAIATSSFYYPTHGKWGPRIQQATQGSLHDHIITFKADFDISGTDRAAVQLGRQQPGHSLENSEFAKTHLAVSRQHDAKVFANSVQNAGNSKHHQQDFSKFFDGESIKDEDLVVWFNSSMHHFTRSEDIPVTLYTEAYSSIALAPQNFFDRAQDGDLLNRSRSHALPPGTEVGVGGSCNRRMILMAAPSFDRVWYNSSQAFSTPYPEVLAFPFPVRVKIGDVFQMAKSYELTTNEQLPDPAAVANMPNLNLEFRIEI
ncbi:amine oxidase catalytic domain-containing protein [Macroventuria anomochaeta]|uniref:Amine oxidase catalytic domain-containing protein n=1 Tax=Macroventuria anomochaeta TaxID=301207 RepID=A0ACB6S6I6_9PLEO|nr:amine oxidase catalytic domain-containing protein [Macroventuria anomochaeta]KAF2629674.1 amine oxidase catalytic domain-containing protein [Macroventuria anomochaeta]